MSLRTKWLLTVAATLVCLLVALYAVSQFIILNGFRRLETEEVGQDMRRILSALDDEKATLDSITRDWAVWDDSYQFVEDRNDAFRESTLADPSFINNRLNLMVYVNSSGQVVFSKALDLHNEEEVPVPGSLSRFLSPGDLLLTHASADSGIAGILSLPEGPMLLSSQPILTSEGTGPIHGALIFGRYFDSKELERLSRTTLFSLEALSPDSADVPPGLGKSPRLLAGETPILIQPLDSNSISGYATLRDIYGNPALVLRAEFPRVVYERGQTTVILFLAVALGIGLLFTVLVAVLQERLVLARLLRLGEVVNQIGKSHDVGKRVPETGRDELSQLGKEMNAMLVSLGQAREEREQALKELQETNERLLDALARLQRAPELVRQERMNALAQMASGVVHDINNSLVPITVLTKVLLQDPDLPSQMDKLKESLTAIKGAANDAEAIVRRLRQFYVKGEEGEPLQPTDLREIAEQSIVLTQPKWKSQALDAGVHIDVAPQLARVPPVAGNAAELREALTNLIFNAVDAMPKGGTITVRAYSTDGRVVLEVSDTGMGMTEEVRRRCMEPFFTTKGERGTGLGLSMVHGIIKRHQGEIEIRTEPGKGTTFALSFPPLQTAASGLTQGPQEGSRHSPV